MDLTEKSQWQNTHKRRFFCVTKKENGAGFPKSCHCAPFSMIWGKISRNLMIIYMRITVLRRNCEERLHTPPGPGPYFVSPPENASAKSASVWSCFSIRSSCALICSLQTTSCSSRIRIYWRGSWISFFPQVRSLLPVHCIGNSRFLLPHLYCNGVPDIHR